jgi:hypothetical protein
MRLRSTLFTPSHAITASASKLRVVPGPVDGLWCRCEGSMVRRTCAARSFVASTFSALVMCAENSVLTFVGSMVSRSSRIRRLEGSEIISRGLLQR